MIKSTLLFILIVCSVTGCADERKLQAFDTEELDEAITLQHLLAHQKEYKDKKVTFGAYFISHFEGAWISEKNGSLNEQFETMLSINHNLTAKFELLESTRARVAKRLGFDANARSLTDRSFSVHEVYHEFNDGIPAIITGIFRVGDYNYPNGVGLENHPYIELIKVREVLENDTLWVAVKPKGEVVNASAAAGTSENHLDD